MSHIINSLNDIEKLALIQQVMRNYGNALSREVVGLKCHVRKLI